MPSQLPEAVLIATCEALSRELAEGAGVLTLDLSGHAADPHRTPFDKHRLQARVARLQGIMERLTAVAWEER